MKSLLQAVQDLHSAELFDDLIFFVSLRLEDRLLDDQLSEGDQALLFKLIGDANFHIENYFQCIKVSHLLMYWFGVFQYFERSLDIVRRLSRSAVIKV